MIFIVLTFLVALSIEALGTLVSVIGLSSLFGANPIIMAFVVALDAGKLITVSLVYNYWGKLNTIMKSYALTAAVITMIITSAGAAGYLSGEFQKAMTGTQEVAVKIEAIQKEQVRLEERKKQIDRQIENLPEKYTANQRTRAINQFKQEQTVVTARLAEIDKELPALQTQQISASAKAGPIRAIAKGFDITPEEAVKWVILFIIVVFDPLAVFLIVAGNFLINQRSLQKQQEKLDASLEKFDQQKHNASNEEPVALAAIIPAATATPLLVQQETDNTAAAGPPGIETVEVLEEPQEQQAHTIKVPEHENVQPLVVPQPEVPTTELSLRNIEVEEDLIDIPSVLPLDAAESYVVKSDPIPVEVPQQMTNETEEDLPTIDVENVPPVVPQEEASARRQVITEADLKTYPAHRSILEDVDANFGDVGTLDGGILPPKNVRHIYEQDAPL